MANDQSPITPSPSRFAAPISEGIWDMKYRLKGPDGAPVDLSVGDTWRRVARAVASVEADPALWEGRFHDALEDFRFLPAGRIVAGAGTGRNVTLFNCFVMGTVEDSMAGIFDALKEAALTMQAGGGIGYDFSTIRPRGAPVKGVGADASGPLSFMDVWDAMCRTIMSAGSRRGAMMATMRCDHPDVEAFVAAKADPARLRMFNLSVLVTDPFMAAVAADGPWDLAFGGEVFRTIRARDLWDRIMRATYDQAEPGVIFIDRINRLNNLRYAETIAATNPCVTGDAWVLTDDGPRQVAELVGRPFRAVVDGVAHPTGPQGFFSTGRKPVLLLRARCGRRLRLTADHLVRRVVSRTRWRTLAEWAPAGSLRPGDEVVVHDHGGARWGAGGDDERGYLLGLLIGDGTIRDDKAVISVWRDPAAPRTGPDPVMVAVEALLRTMPHRADFAGWQPVPNGWEHRIATAALTRLAGRYGLSRGRKTLTPEIERASSAFQAAVLRGLFDADGSVQGNQAKGVSVRLAQSDPQLLEAAQRMLGRLGIVGAIHAERRDAGRRLMPDGRGGRALYAHAAQHELIVSGANLLRFAERVGFLDEAKAARLSAAMAGYRRSLNRERFTAVVEAVEPDGEAEVFDVQVPGVNAFDANGFVVHNCGEQPLPPYGACLLGSVNLARLVRRPFEAGAGIDDGELADLVGTAVRMMDDVVDLSRFPLPEQRHEAQAKRRIGLGVTGLADALMMVGLRYGSPEAVDWTRGTMRAVARAAYLASARLAGEKGAFPLFDRERFLDGDMMRRMDAEVREAVAAHGIRNALLTSVAPTGTISLYAGNVSSGIEPVFAYSYTRKVLMPDGSRREEAVEDFAVALWRRLRDGEPFPAHFVDAQGLAPLDHVRMQAAAQEWVDSSISKTINVPEDIPFEAFRDVYQAAYDMGCKGCTTYRPNAVTGSVLSVAEAPPAPKEDAPMERPAELEGATYKIRWPASEHALYVTVNDVLADGRRRPFEVFINSKNMENYAWTVALTRMISAVFRRGGEVAFVVDELKAIFDPRGGAWMNGRYVPSILAAIGDVIERHMRRIGFLGGDAPGAPGASAGPTPVRRTGGFDDAGWADAPAGAPDGAAAGAMGATCPSCGSPGAKVQEGCLSCDTCGYSRCG